MLTSAEPCVEDHSTSIAQGLPTVALLQYVSHCNELSHMSVTAVHGRLGSFCRELWTRSNPELHLWAGQRLLSCCCSHLHDSNLPAVMYGSLAAQQLSAWSDSVQSLYDSSMPLLESSEGWNCVMAIPTPQAITWTYPAVNFCKEQQCTKIVFQEDGRD